MSEMYATTLPPYETWEGTQHYAWCRGGPGKLEWLGQMFVCRETGERRFEPLPMVEVDENGTPKAARTHPVQSSQETK